MDIKLLILAANIVQILFSVIKWLKTLAEQKRQPEPHSEGDSHASN
jgi:hypothetical protein